MNYKMILNTLGIVLNFEGLCLLLPLLCSLVYSEGNALIYLFCISACIIPGVLLTLNKPEKKTMYQREGFIIVALSWIVMSLFGAIPFVATGSINSFVDAFFETASGFTTTGASILNDVEALSKSIIMWRSFTHFLGGMGVIVFIVAILKLSGGSNIYLIKAESPGPSVSKLVPKVGSTAKILYGMYIMLTFLEVMFLLAGGMTLFEALTLSFGTAGTGGFGILNTSIADYTSYQQIVITVFMIMFGIDFSVYYLILLRRFKFRELSEEVRVYLGIILVSAVLISVNCMHLYTSVFDNLKHTFFQIASVITTTGYSTVDYDKWPELSKTVIVILMFIGACAGSTGGGIKVSRILILFKSYIKQIKITAHPRHTYKLKINNRPLEHETLRSVNVYMAAYISVFALGLLLISLDNFDFTTNFTAVSATLNNIGPGLNLVGPTCNFSFFSDFSKIVFSLLMIIGRLELFPILILASATTWKD